MREIKLYGPLGEFDDQTTTIAVDNGPDGTAVHMTVGSEGCVTNITATFTLDVDNARRLADRLREAASAADYTLNQLSKEADEEDCIAF